MICYNENIYTSDLQIVIEFWLIYEILESVLKLYGRHPSR